MSPRGQTGAIEDRGEAARPRAGVVVAVFALLVLIAVIAAAAVFVLGDDEAPSPAAAGEAPLDLPALGLEHVHGLGVDPADGVLYAASHYGVFRLPEDGPAVRVADRYQDTMGFTVTGPNTFLGSGHPDLSEDLPARLGLIESTDAAQTWTPLSLQGEADFHALHAAHGRVYGYDSTTQTFMVSPDRREWERRSRLPLRDFVVHPAEPDTVLATGQEPLIRSTDGARSWNTIAGAPKLVVLAWPAPDSLYGVAPDGSVHHSPDGGASWTKRGDAGGVPEALTVDPRGETEILYAAISGRGIVRSNDGGRTFSVHHAEPPS